MEFSSDQVNVHFSAESLTVLNWCLGFIMFVVALDLKPQDFRRILLAPKATLTGLISQFLLLPAATFGLIFILRPDPAISLGMFLVAACPGGVISNFITHLSNGNTALSVSLTAISTPLAVFMTPFNFSLWAGILPQTNTILENVQLNPLNMFQTILTLIIIPVTLGMFIANTFPALSSQFKKPAKILSLLIFLGFLIVAFFTNYEVFIHHIQFVIILVFIHNATALLTGYLFARAVKLSEKDSRAVCIETGIQNSGLGLILIFNFFDGMGGMALVTAWWGVWHIISGLMLAWFWSKRKTAQD